MNIKHSNINKCKEHWWRPKHDCDCFTWHNLLKIYPSPCEGILISSPLYRWWHWGTKQGGHISKVTGQNLKTGAGPQTSCCDTAPWQSSIPSLSGWTCTNGPSLQAESLFSEKPRWHTITSSVWEDYLKYCLYYCKGYCDWSENYLSMINVLNFINVLTLLECYRLREGQELSTVVIGC